MKKNWLKISAILLACAMLATTIVACGGDVEETSTEAAQQTEAKDYSDEVDVSHYLPEYTFVGDENSLKDHLTEQPVYTLEEGASTDEMRAMAVKSMYDSLTFQWTPDSNISYTKKTNGNDKEYSFQKNIIYGGTPYSDGGRGILNMLEYYDYNTGVLVGMSDVTNPNHDLGNSCASSTNWGNACVCPNLLATSTYYLTPTYGYVPTSDYEFPNITRFDDVHNTGYIIELNGEERMYEAYAACLPGDALDRNANPEGGDHVMMVYSAPTVVRDENGKIDPEQSTLCIIDQWASEYSYTMESGQEESIRGRINKEFTFSYLLSHKFIPMTPVDYLSETGYVKGTATLNTECSTYEELLDAVITTNYRTVKYEGCIVSESGTVVYVNKYLTEPSEYIVKQDRTIKVSKLYAKSAAKKVMRDDRTYTFRVQALLATGETIVVAEVPITIDQVGRK